MLLHMIKISMKGRIRMKADISENVSRYFGRILAFLLSFILSSSVFSVYSIPFFSVWTLAITAVTLLAFLLYEFVNKHHFIGGIILTVIIMVDLSAFFRLVFSYDYGEGFQKWFLTGAEQADTRTTYLLAVLISFVPFFAVVIFYFSQILYRMSFLTLISLIPCALYVKVLSEIDNVYISLIAILNIAMLINNNRIIQNNMRKVSGQKAALLSGAVFSFFVLIVSAVIPKENDAKYYDRFEELFMDSSFQIELDESYSLFSEFSGNADNYRDFSNRRMYTLVGENVPYFKRQTFDYYDFENDRWYADEKHSAPVYTMDEWEDKRALLSLDNFRDAVIKADEYEAGFLESFGLGKLAGYTGFSDEVKQVFVYPEEFPAMYYLSPARGITKIKKSTDTNDIYVTRHGIFRNINTMHTGTDSYVIRYYDEFESRFLWPELGGTDFSNDEYSLMLAELERILTENNDELAPAVKAFLDEYIYSREYNSVCADNNNHISEEIKGLARTITAGLEYDWQKADALQNYFFNEGYIYDLRYISRDTSPEYFLFESKRGSCSDFATAYVLLARSVGLTVRYAEGYIPDITSHENTFVIKDSCSHAYPEVFIQGMGWIVFEPTVPSDYSQVDTQTAGNIEMDYNLIFVLCVISFLILVLILMLIFILPVISERKFIRSLKKTENGICAVMIYKRMINSTAKGIIKNTQCLTPSEFAERVNMLTECDIGIIVSAVEEYAYGGNQIPDNFRKDAVNCYNDLKSAVKEYKKQLNKQKRNKRSNIRKDK